MRNAEHLKTLATRVPRRPRAGNATVELTFIGNVPQCAPAGAVVEGCYTSDRVAYYYMALDSLLPLSGPATGGTKLTIRGANLGSCGLRGLACSFSGVLVPGHLINSSALWCLSPPSNRTGDVLVEARPPLGPRRPGCTTRRF